MKVLLGNGGAILTEDKERRELQFPFLSISVKDKELQTKR